APLGRLGWLHLVIDEERLWQPRRMDQRVQRCRVRGQVGVAPGHLPRLRGGAGRRESDCVSWVRELLNLIDREVEQRSVVIDADAPENRGLVLRVQSVREPQARLERAVERLSVAPRADVSVQVERGRERVVIPSEGVDDYLGRYVVGVQ